MVVSVFLLPVLVSAQRVFLLPVLVSAQREEEALVLVAFLGAFTGPLGAYERGWRGGGACSARRCLSRRGSARREGLGQEHNQRRKEKRHKKKRVSTAAHLRRTPRRLPV
eukprot:COSAG02_NODE_796_length_17128_cov_176.587586_3_plen_110_part_00